MSIDPELRRLFAVRLPEGPWIAESRIRGRFALVLAWRPEFVAGIDGWRWQKLIESLPGVAQKPKKE